MKEEGIEALKDWRGTPINIEDTVIYTATHGRSGSLVEAKVVGFTASGRVLLDVIRESFGYRVGKPVNVGADRVTVVGELPATKVPTIRERRISEATNLLKRYEDDLALLQGGEQVSPEWRNRDYYNAEYVEERVNELRQELEDLRQK